jgi:hypothetical protein
MGYFTRQTEADVDDASSSDFPSGFGAHYMTFPSIDSERFSRSRERLPFRLTVASLAASLVLLLVASLLVAMDGHKLRVEVGAGATGGIVSSFSVATLGFGTMLYRSQTFSRLHRSCVVVTFAAVCILNGILLVLVIGKMRV